MNKKYLDFFKYRNGRFVADFIGEFITNCIVANIPNSYIRYCFYRYVLKVKMDISVFIQMGCYLYKSLGELCIGKFTIVNRKCILDRRGGLYIGSNVNISSEVAIFTAGHEINAPDFSYYTKSVYIEDYVWIGTRSMVMPGVRIGRGAVVLPGAVVVHNVQEFEVVGGVPAVKVGLRNDKLDYKLTWRAMFT